MTFDDDVLNRLAPAIPWESDWADVLERAGARERHRPRRLRGKRRLILALAVLAAVLIPLIALGAKNDWWFLKYGPAPTRPPVIVKEGNWNGHPWELIAYPTADSLCYLVIPAGSTTKGSGGCASFAGFARTNETKKASDLTITFMSGGGYRLPAWIVGPVIESASQVEIRFENGKKLRIPTFAAPASLGHVRFYASPLPAGVSPSPKSIAGLDNDGNVIACLAPATTKNGGTSPLSACK